MHYECGEFLKYFLLSAPVYYGYIMGILFLVHLKIKLNILMISILYS